MPDALAGLGATLIGLSLAIWLSSTCVHYTSSYARRTLDHGVWKLVIGFLALVNTAHTAVLCYELYVELVRDQRGTDVITHLYFVAKLATLYDVRPQSILVASSFLFSCISLGFGIVSAYSSKQFDVSLFDFDLHSKFGWQLFASSLSAILADTVISSGMLVHMRSGKYAAREETVLEVISRYFLETNLLATIVRILSLAFLLAWNAEGRESGVSLALSFVLPGLYLLSMLASLDAVEDATQAGLSRTMKHASSLSDMFKGVPLNRMDSPAIRERYLPSQISATPIADRFAGGATSPSDQRSWLRRTFQPASTPLQPGSVPLPTIQETTALPKHASRPVTAFSVSDYGDYLGLEGETSEKKGRPVGLASSPLANGAISTSVDVPAQTPTPRRATFALEDEGKRGNPGTPTGGTVVETTAFALGRKPVTYGYL
ncbi:hypothetical protein JCM10049v2_007733 [Rhodotorula toruloides]